MRIANPLLRWKLGIGNGNSRRAISSERVMCAPIAVCFVMFFIAGLLDFNDEFDYLDPVLFSALFTSLAACFRRRWPRFIHSHLDHLRMAHLGPKDILLALIPIEFFGFVAVATLKILIQASELIGYHYAVPFICKFVIGASSVVSCVISVLTILSLPMRTPLFVRFPLCIAAGFILDPTFVIIFGSSGNGAVRLVEHLGYEVAAVIFLFWFVRLYLLSLLFRFRLRRLRDYGEL